MISYDDYCASHERDEDRPCVECHDDGPTYTTGSDTRLRCAECIDDDETCAQRAEDEAEALLRTGWSP